MKLRISVEGKTYDVDVEVVNEAPPPPPEVALPVLAIKPPPPPLSRGRLAAKSDEKTCRSPMAGVVASVAVSVGQAVEKNALLLVIEAMKMETRINSLGAGVVKSVPAKAGDSVKPGQVLIELE